MMMMPTCIDAWWQERRMTVSSLPVNFLWKTSRMMNAGSFSGFRRMGFINCSLTSRSHQDTFDVIHLSILITCSCYFFQCENFWMNISPYACIQICICTAGTRAQMGLLRPEQTRCWFYCDDCHIPVDCVSCRQNSTDQPVNYLTLSMKSWMTYTVVSITN